MPRGTPTAVAKAPTARRSAAPLALTAEYVASLEVYATLLFKGGLTPKGVSRPEHIAARIAVGRDLGITDTQAIANIMIVGGRPSIWGDLGMAMIRASNLLEDIEETYEGEPGTESYTAVCRVKRKDAKRDRVSKFSIADAIRANLWDKPGPWQEYPERQMMWRAKGFATRDEFQDVLCGLIFTEEALDIPARQVETVEVKAIVDAASPRGKVVVLPADVPAATITQAREDDPVKFLSPGPPDETFPLVTAGELTAPDVAVKVTSGKLSDEQLDRLVELRAAVIERRGIADDDAAIDQMWMGTLADYGVESARDLTGEQAHELIADIMKGLAVTPVEPAPKAKRARERVQAL